MTLSIDIKYVRLLSSRLRNFKQKKDGLYNFSCPICGDSKKNLTKARGYAYSKSNELFYMCHNCGASLNFGNFIKTIDPYLHKEYVLERYKSGKTNNVSGSLQKLQLSTPKFDVLKKRKQFEHAESIDRLPSGHFCLEYVKSRKIPTCHYDKLFFTSNYKKFIDTLVPNHKKENLPEDARLVIPFYDEYNDLIAVTGRSLESGDYKLRYLTIRTNDSIEKLIYGMDRLDKTKNAFLVEGPIDSLFLDNSIASGDSNLLHTAEILKIPNLVLIFDNQPRNKDIVKLMNKAIEFNYNIVIWPTEIQGKDINEMVLSGLSKDDIQDIISKNTFNTINAMMNFNLWKRI